VSVAWCVVGYRAIKVGECHIFVELPAVQDIAEVSITAIPPDAEDISVSVQAHQVVEIDLIDCLILCSGEVELVSHLVREEEGFVLCCIIAHCVLGRAKRQSRALVRIAQFHNPFGRQPWCCLLYLFFPVYFLEA